MAQRGFLQVKHKKRFRANLVPGISDDRTLDALDEIKKPEPKTLGFQFECAHSFKFNNSFWTCVNRVTAVSNAGSYPLSNISLRSQFHGANQGITVSGGRDCPFPWTFVVNKSLYGIWLSSLYRGGSVITSSAMHDDGEICNTAIIAF